METGVAEIENQSIPFTVNNHFEHDFAVNKWVILDECVLLINSTQIDGILAVCGCGSVHGTLPSPTHILITFTVRGFDTFLP